MLSRLLKSLVVSVWVLTATLALALPTPKDIEDAVAAGHYSQAERMLLDVLQDKPQSAKAHYELGQVLVHERRYTEAQTQLQKAKDLDPSLKFASSPEKFNTVFAKVKDLAAAPSSSVVMSPSVAPSTQVATQVPPSAAPSGGGMPLGYVWLVIAGLVVFGLWLRRSAAANASDDNFATQVTPMGAPPTQRGFGAQFTPNAPQAAYPAQGYGPQGYTQPASGGSTMAGAVVGGLAGVAAGYALSKALEGDHPVASTPSSAGASSVVNNSGYVPFDTPSQPDVGAFDAGSGSDWDSADSGSVSDDSW
jgi:hypothetical protein